jgi:hypothetical protein
VSPTAVTRKHGVIIGQADRAGQQPGHGEADGDAPARLLDKGLRRRPGIG